MSKTIKMKREKKKLQSAIDKYVEDRDLLFSKYGIPDLELCFNSENLFYKTNIKDFIYVFKSSDCIYAFGTTFRCGHHLSVTMIDTQKVQVGGRDQFEYIFKCPNVLNHHLLGNLLINNVTREYVNITEKTEGLAREKGLEYYTISHYTYLEIAPLYASVDGIPFRFQSPVMFNDEVKLNGLIKFFTLATNYSIHLSTERILAQGEMSVDSPYAA